MLESIHWSSDGWEHQIREEGHMFKWKARHVDGKTVDFGLIPGGAYVAIRRLLIGSPDNWMV